MSKRSVSLIGFAGKALLVLFLLIGNASSVDVYDGERNEIQNNKGLVNDHRLDKPRCGILPTSEEKKVRIRETVEHYKNKNRVRRNKLSQLYEFDVYWHIIEHSNGKGKVTDDQIKISMDLLNQGFSGNLINANKDCNDNTVSGIETSIRFVLKGIDRTTNDQWFVVSSENDVLQQDIGNALYKGNCATMNVYTAVLDAGGFASLPIDCFDSPPKLDAVYLNHEEIFDTSLEEMLAQGSDVLIHEAGHWVGLEHPFEGGCSGSNDLIADTPPQKVVEECTIGSDTCPGGGVDSIHNYMSYTDDCCMYRFTPGQITYAHAQLNKYRSNDSPPSTTTKPTTTTTTTTTTAPISTPTTTTTTTPVTKPVKTPTQRPTNSSEENDDEDDDKEGEKAEDDDKEEDIEDDDEDDDKERTTTTAPISTTTTTPVSKPVKTPTQGPSKSSEENDDEDDDKEGEKAEDDDKEEDIEDDDEDDDKERVKAEDDDKEENAENDDEDDYYEEEEAEDYYGSS